MKKILRFIDGHYLRIITPILLTVMATASMAREYIIYSISQEISMGHKGEKQRKNYYINMGRNQGLKANTSLDVFRSVSRIDPFDSNKRYNYKVKVGELKVIHSEDQASIASQQKWEPTDDELYVELRDFLIGDNVEIHLSR